MDQSQSGDERGADPFVDLTATRRAIESAFAADLHGGEYERDVRPYLEPMSYLVASGRLDGDRLESLMLLVFE